MEFVRGKIAKRPWEPLIDLIVFFSNRCCWQRACDVYYRMLVWLFSIHFLIARCGQSGFENFFIPIFSSWAVGGWTYVAQRPFWRNRWWFNFLCTWALKLFSYRPGFLHQGWILRFHVIEHQPGPVRLSWEETPRSSGKTLKMVLDIVVSSAAQSLSDRAPAFTIK